MRIISDGTNLTASYSYNGNTFTPVGRPASLATFADPKIGPAALSDLGADRPGGALRLDPVRPGRLGRRRRRRHRRQLRRHRRSAPPGRGSAATRPRSSSGGTLQIPAQPGDIYQTRNDAQEPDRPRRARRCLGRRSRSSTSRAPPSTTRPGSWSTATTTTSRSSAASRTRAAGDEKFEFINEVNARRAQRSGGLDGEHPGGLPGRLLAPADVRRDQRRRALLDRRDHVDPGRAPGGAAGGRQDRPVRVLQRRRRATRSRPSTRSPSPVTRSAAAAVAAVRRPARATTTSSTARRSTRRAGTRSCATPRPSTRVAGGELDDHAQPGRHLHGRHQPAAEQLHPPGRVARRRGLGDRDQDQRLHDRRRLRARAACWPTWTATTT